ncbi:MAG: hypothetical protein WA766_13120, partial [Candidatus Acidiferrales bacterium]
FFILSCDDWSWPEGANANEAIGSDKLHMSIPEIINFFIGFSLDFVMSGPRDFVRVARRCDV